MAELVFGRALSLFLGKVAAYCSRTRFWIVPRDKGYRLEVAACPLAGVISRMKAGKMVVY